MIEVETKIRIENPEGFRRKASQIGKFKGKIKKIDDYYTLEPINKYPKKSLRIRKTGNNYQINFKQRISYSKEIYAKKESEFAVSDVESFLALIKDFGFKHWLRKEKISEVYKIKNNFHIEINNVKSLGWFLEIEYLTKNNINYARKEIIRILKKLKVRRSQIV